MKRKYYIIKHKIEKTLNHVRITITKSYHLLIICFSIPCILSFYFFRNTTPSFSDLSNFGVFIVAVSALKMAQNQLNWPRIENSILIAQEVRTNYLPLSQNFRDLTDICIKYKDESLDDKDLTTLRGFNLEIMIENCEKISTDINRIDHNLTILNKNEVSEICRLFTYFKKVCLSLSSKEITCKDDIYSEIDKASASIISTSSKDALKNYSEIRETSIGTLLYPCDVAEYLEENIRKMKG